MGLRNKEVQRSSVSSDAPVLPRSSRLANPPANPSNSRVGFANVSVVAISNAQPMNTRTNALFCQLNTPRLALKLFSFAQSSASIYVAFRNDVLGGLASLAESKTA